MSEFLNVLIICTLVIVLLSNDWTHKEVKCTFEFPPITLEERSK